MCEARTETAERRFFGCCGCGIMLHMPTKKATKGAKKSAKKTTKKKYYQLEPKRLFKDFESTKDGLGIGEVRTRQQRYGSNELEQHNRQTVFQKVLKQFKSPLIYILLIAVVITGLLDELIDMSVILVVVIANTIIGYLHESRADKAFEKLTQALSKKAFVIRDGSAHEIDARDIVPGDILMLRAGEKVAADARILEAQNLQVDESMLTGEWVPVSKTTKLLKGDLAVGDQKNMVFMNTIVQRGEGRALVVAIGGKTEVGKIANLIQTAQVEHTPFQKKLAHLGRVIGLLVGIVTVLIFGLGVTLGHEVTEMFLTSVALAVAVIPEGLPVAMSVVLAIATRKILKKRGLVKNLVAAETLGSASVILTDKTGTLTEGRMAVSEIVGFGRALNRKHEQRLLESAVFAGDSIVEDPDNMHKKLRFKGSPTDRAIAMHAYEHGINKLKLEKKHRRKARLNFDNRRKFLSSVHSHTKTLDLISVAGAPERLIERSTKYEVNGKSHKLTKAKQDEMRKLYDKLASQGLRVIGIAYATKRKTDKWSTYDDLELEVEMKGLTMLGLVALRDPVRPTSKRMIKKAIRAGIRPVIVTGDHKLTARAVAAELGFSVDKEAMMEGAELDDVSDEELREVVKKVSIFARVNPEHKLRIVDAWQSLGETVAMTGDGINDAPALKQADIGVAVGSGTDIAKESADLVLLNDKFSTIVSAIKEGRVGFDNIRKIIVYLLADSFSLFILILGSLFLGLPLAILPAQVLWINLIQDSFPTFALGFEPAEKGIMRRKPVPRNQRIVDGQLRSFIFLVGIITDIMLLGLFIYLINSGMETTLARTVIFAALSTYFFVNLYAIKSLRQPIWRIKPFSNKFLAISLGFGIVMMFAAIYTPFLNHVLRTTPLPAYTWGIVVIMAVVNLIGVEIVKAVYRNKT